ncbi:MAG: FtsQ-type POTRA domain-containing protein [Sphingomonadaceae bacterium]|nr:FtsQ-type POTRA domain-containing protein [Sphingomonadaceae bacterium]
MNAAVIKRGATPRRKAVVRRKPPAMVRVPLAPRRFARHAASAFIALVLIAAIAAAIVAGLPGRAWQETARAAARSGFEVRHVEVHGVATGPRLEVIAAALEGPTNSMLLVDLAAARARLVALPWVADASVARRLPDTLIVDVTERRPVALWQLHHRLVVIDRAGVPLTSNHLERFAALPLVVGPEANTHVGDLIALLAAAPRLGRLVDAATYVGTRRWDLRFRSGETLLLPEGAAAGAALARFELLDRSTGLIAHGYARFDLRVPGQMTVRVAAPVKPTTPAPVAKPAAPAAPPPPAGTDAAVQI